MVSFSISAAAQSTHSVDAWRSDPELRRAIAATRIRPNYSRGAKLFHKAIEIGELCVSVTGASAALVYESVPIETVDDERTYFLLMPDRLRQVEIAGKTFVQQVGECVLLNHSAAVVASYAQPHTGICLSMPADIVRQHMPVLKEADGMRFGSVGTSSRMIFTLLLSVWHAAEAGMADSHGLSNANALLRLLGERSLRLRSATDGIQCTKGLSCESIKQRINADIRNPLLSVQLIAEKLCVTTRYLQMLFAQEGECVSEYIKKERLRGCLLDLRDGGFDHQSITEIAFSWGFNSAAHFSSLFRRWTSPAWSRCAR